MSEQTSAPDQSLVPPLTREIREQARRSPATWIYSVDPAYDPDGAVPGYAIVGAWQVDSAGEPGTFTANPQYRPSPLALDMPTPTDEVDSSMQRAATGHGTDAEVLDALARSTVYLPASADGALIAYRDRDGEYVSVFTDPQQASSSAPQLLPVKFLDLIDVLPDTTALWIDPDSQVSVGVSTTEVRAALHPQGSLPEIPRKGHK